MKWTSRKLAVAVVVFSVSSVLLWYDHIGSSEWQWVTSISVGAYLVGQGLVDAFNK